ncbi:MAG TPA: DNA ligase (NAD(+)) LigA, partial [Lachnospiraceae bacterium]|nr:DNA ligase (NAD(+)) LigA [Lachnospiraceae bacterium]
GFIKELPDLFKLSRFKDEIENMEGFGEKSYVNLIEACENARTTTLARFLYALGIAGVGSANAKILARFFDEDYEKIKGAGFDEISEAEGFGGVLAMAVSSYFSDEKKLKEADGLYKELNIQAPVQNTEKSENISGKTFVITGSVYHFSNRSELKEYIEERGGKVSGSVSAKTDYLINNDVTSTSGKNKKAKELGVKIISEEDFLNL